jgi:hypothetical protein
MGPFKYKGERYFVEEFVEECPNAKGNEITPFAIFSACDDDCPLCHGDGMVAYTRFFKEIPGDPRKARRPNEFPIAVPA